MKFRHWIALASIPLSAMAAQAEEGKRPMMNENERPAVRGQVDPGSDSDAEVNGAAVSMLNELLRGEISAVETYKQANEKLGSDPQGNTIKQFAKDHQEAVDTLTKLVKARNGVPTEDSGAWGVWAETVMGSAKILGDEPALKALKEGEEHGVKEYEEALNNQYLSNAEKEVIKNKLIIAQHKHIKALNSMMEKM